MNHALYCAQSFWNETVLKPFFELHSEASATMSRPYYMAVSDEYVKSARRIMIIGQETKGFGLYTDLWSFEDIREWGVDYLRKQIYGIDSVKNKCTYNRSAFWNFFRLLERSGFAPCWNNIDKIHQTVSGNTVPLSIEMEAYFCKQYGTPKQSLIQQEIDICKPNCILLITGPNYTHSMSASFGIEETTLSHYRPKIGSPIADITELLDLGVKTIWTYHPTFLNRHHVLNDVANQVIKLLS